MAAAGSIKNPRHPRHPRSKKIRVIRVPIPSAFLFAEHVRLGDSRNMAAAGSIKNPRHPRSKKIRVIRLPIPSAFLFHPRSCSQKAFGLMAQETLLPQAASKIRVICVIRVLKNPRHPRSYSIRLPVPSAFQIHRASG
jgi:hypothetical protein